MRVNSLDRKSKILTGAPSRLHSPAGTFRAGWGMLVESETCPCDKTVPEWLYHVFIEKTYPHGSIFLILSNLEEQRLLEGRNSSSSDIPISVTQARSCLSVQTTSASSASRKYRDVLQPRETMIQLSMIIRGTSASVGSPMMIDRSSISGIRTN